MEKFIFTLFRTSRNSSKMLLKTGKITASKFIPYLLLLLYSIAAFHQVAFLKATFKWDYISYYFPVRYYVSECIRHGNMPLWMIYEGCGYPLYGDPQSGAWYPVVWIISLIHGYDIYAASFEFMLTIFIAGAGFYTLASGLKISRTVSFITAVAYMSCGFFIGNAQHLTLLISGAYLPFIIHFYMRFISELHYRDALCTALFLFLMFTGGYPAIFFILFYFLLIIFIIKLIRRIYVSDRDFVKKFLSLHLLMIISFLLMSAVFLVSIFQCMPYSTRGGPITLDDALLYAFTPQSMLSFITPFALQRNTPFFNTDVSMSNGYFGIVFLILLIYSLFDRKSKLQFLFLILSIIFLAASLG
ncbi:MAG: hypothetical protein JJE25_01850, partial [Bacteroidia bacterium]|nr:hypothetical protein [Bacteroidia bacterium]